MTQKTKEVVMIQSVFKRYKNIAPFGCMCSLALHLRKIGLRSSSCFFDWLTSDLAHNMEIVDNDFNDFFNKKYFKQEYPDYAHLITNTKYNFVYSHVFNPKQTLDKQYESVKKRVQRGIDNFKKALSDDCLLIYYSRSKKETDWIRDNQDKIKAFCLKHRCDITFVLNFDIDGPFIFPKYIIPQNNIHKPIGGGVSYLFEKTEKLDEYLLSVFDPEERQKNLRHVSKESLFIRIKRKLYSFRKDRLVV